MKQASKVLGITGRSIPAIGQGTWNMPGSGAAWEQAKKALRHGIQLGLTHIDTAEMYGSGKAEQLVGEAIRDIRRQDLFVVSKVLPENASYKGTIAACEKTLKHLGTDYLDCYLLHWRGSIPLSDTMRALERLVDDGKILNLGVSNFDVDDLEEAMQCLEKHKIACNQVLYNLHERGIERRLIPFCEKHQCAIVGYTPFAQRRIPSGAGGAVLSAIAEKHNATARQIILAFLVRQPNTFTIPKAATADHVTENAGALAIELDHNDIERLSEAFPAPKKDVPLATL